MTAPAPVPRFRDQLAEVLKAHTVVAFAGCDSMCACDRKWRTNIAYREHLAAEVEARVQAAANQRAVEELEALRARLAADEDAPTDAALEGLDFTLRVLRVRAATLSTPDGA